MIYVSIDTETSGLGENAQILEFAAVIENTEKNANIDELPFFHCYLKHDVIIGEPYALAMNQNILYEIANSESKCKKITPDQLGRNFGYFLNTILRESEPDERNRGKVPQIKIIVAGKNFASFDRPKLERLSNFSNYVIFHHRVIDPSILFYKEGDLELPNSKLCMERAGLSGEVAHNALDDAKMVIKLVRKGLKTYNTN